MKRVVRITRAFTLSVRRLTTSGAILLIVHTLFTIDQAGVIPCLPLPVINYVKYDFLAPTDRISDIVKSWPRLLGTQWKKSAPGFQGNFSPQITSLLKIISILITNLNNLFMIFIYNLICNCFTADNFFFFQFIMTKNRQSCFFRPRKAQKRMKIIFYSPLITQKNYV